MTTIDTVPTLGDGGRVRASYAGGWTLDALNVGDSLDAGDPIWVYYRMHRQPANFRYMLVQSMQQARTLQG